ncbi:MAG: heparinase II/III family protein, partial [Candidatus Dactylopiibacterium sp.]|nr:heparinase II/III family protein [Candidatus Dactylopiibacterium sp.]
MHLPAVRPRFTSLRLVCLLLWLPMAASAASAETDIVAARAAELSARIPPAHPRLLVRAAELPALRRFVSDALPALPEGAKLASFAIPATTDAALIAQPEAVSNGTPEGARRWREGYQAASAAGVMAQRHAFAWLLTQDPAQGRAAARALLHLASWKIDAATYRANDELFIQHLRPMIFAYDWAADALSDAERATVRRALGERLTLLAGRIQPKFSLLTATPPDNSLSHPMRFISTLGQGGLALLHEVPEAAGWLAWSYEYYLRQFPVWGGPAGGWAEGLDYWSTGITQHQRFLEGMAQLGFDAPLARPFWRNTPYFAIYGLMPYGGSSFGDLTNIIRPSGSTALILEKAAVLGHDPYPLAFAQALRQKPPTGDSYYTYGALDALLTRWRTVQAQLPAASLADLPQSRYFDDIGVVAMHSALGDAARDIMFALRASPQGSASHGFADQNSFVLNAFGEPLAINSGYREFYGSAHHVGWTRQTRAKNAVLFGGEGQRIRDASATGRITRFADGKRFSFASGDAQAAYAPHATQALRHAFFVNRRYVVLLDEAAAPAPVRFQWLLHARGEMQLAPATGEIVQRQGDARLTARLLQPAATALSFSQTSAFDPPVQESMRRRMPDEWHARVETRAEATAVEFLSLLYPWHAGDPAGAPASTPLPASEGHALRVGDDTVLIAREAARRVRTPEWTFDGMAASLTPQDRALDYALVDATRIAGAFLLEASAPLSAEGHADARVFTLAATLAAPATLTLRPAFAVREVRGAAHWATAPGGGVRVTLPAG